MISHNNTNSSGNNNYNNYYFYNLNKNGIQHYKLKFKVKEQGTNQLLEQYRLWRVNQFFDAQIGLMEKYHLTICELINPDQDMLFSNILQRKILFRMMNDQVLILRLNSFSKQKINSYYELLFELIHHIQSRLYIFEFSFQLDPDLFPHFMKLIKNMENLRYLTIQIKKDQIDYEQLNQCVKSLSKLIYLDIKLPSDNTSLGGKNNSYIGNLLECVSTQLEYLSLQLPKRNQFCMRSMNNIYYNLRKFENLTHLSLVLRGTSSYYHLHSLELRNPYVKRIDRSLNQHLNMTLLRVLSDSISKLNLVHLELDLSFQSSYLIIAYNKDSYETVIEVIISLFKSISMNVNLRYLNLILKEWSNVFANQYAFIQLLRMFVNLENLQSLSLDLSKVDIPQHLQYYLFYILTQLKYLKIFNIICCSDPHYTSNEAVYFFKNSKFVQDYLVFKNTLLALIKKLYKTTNSNYNINNNYNNSNNQDTNIFFRKEILFQILFSYLVDYNQIIDSNAQLSQFFQ